MSLQPRIARRRRQEVLARPIARAHRAENGRRPRDLRRSVARLCADRHDRYRGVRGGDGTAPTAERDRLSRSHCAVRISIARSNAAAIRECVSPACVRSSNRRAAALPNACRANTPHNFRFRTGHDRRRKVDDVPADGTRRRRRGGAHGWASVCARARTVRIAHCAEAVPADLSHAWHAARLEMARTVEDVLARRTGLLFRKRAEATSTRRRRPLPRCFGRD